MARGRRPENLRRAARTLEYELTKGEAKGITETFLDQLDHCKNESARRVLLGKGRTEDDQMLTTTHGQWKHNHTDHTLNFGRGLYTIDLLMIHSSAELLDWIFQINQKTWATAIVMQDLLNAFDEIFDPQANLCPCGEDRRLPKSYLFNQEENHVPAE